MEPGDGMDEPKTAEPQGSADPPPPLHAGRWLAAWTVLGLAAGLALATGDTGHLPAWLLPPLVAVAAAAAGGLALLGVLAVRRAVPATARGGWPGLLLAAAAGGAATALLADPLGVLRTAAFGAGLLAGLIAGRVARSRAG